MEDGPSTLINIVIDIDYRYIFTFLISLTKPKGIKISNSENPSITIGGTIPNLKARALKVICQYMDGSCVNVEKRRIKRTRKSPKKNYIVLYFLI